MKKRLLALALCLVMLIGLIPAALAGDPVSDGGATELKKYVIHYDANGGTLIGEATAEVAPQNTETGETGLIPQRDATLNGYKLNGWNWGYTEAADKGEWKFTTPLAKTPTHVYLKAEWEQCTITYRKAQDEAAEQAVEKYTDGYKIKKFSELSWTEPDGEEFECWKASDGTEYQAGKPLTDLHDHLVLYATYKKTVLDGNYYTITYRGENGEMTSFQAVEDSNILVDPNGGKYNKQTGEQPIAVDGPKTIADAEPVNVGMRFVGWVMAKNSDGVVTLTAKWNTDPVEHTVSYTSWNYGKTSIKLKHNTVIIVDPNGGSFTYKDSATSSVTTFTLTEDYKLSDASYIGYAFYGWRVTQTDRDVVTFTAVWDRTVSATYDVYYYDYTDSKYEYYRFTAGTYLVFDPNGGTAKLNNTSFSSQKGFYIYNDYTLSDAVRTGYTFYGWYLTKSGSTYTFTAMWSKSASDVPYMLNGEDHYAYIKGYPNGSFKPNATITRAETAAIFYRLLTDTTRKAYTTTYNAFKDVPAKAWYNTAVSTMAKLGIVTGDANGYFRPSDPITRAEIAAMIARCDGSYYGSSYTNFSDVKGHWAASYIARAYELGWINGYGTTYAPDKYITRAETVAILNRVLNRAPQNTSDLLSGRNTFSDVGTASWYYLDVEEAANSHTYTRKSSGYEYWNRLIADPSWL